MSLRLTEMCFKRKLFFSIGGSEKISRLTLLPVATVSQKAAACWPQLVHVKGTTVTNPDVLRPSTAAAVPVETHCPIDNALRHCGVPTRKPSWRMRTTLLFRHTRVRHLLSCASLDPIPGLGQVAVAFIISNEALSAVSLIQNSVG